MNEPTIESLNEDILDDENYANCNWCKENMEVSELYRTDLGLLCDICIRAIKSRGESVVMF